MVQVYLLNANRKINRRNNRKLIKNAQQYLNTYKIHNLPMKLSKLNHKC